MSKYTLSQRIFDETIRFQELYKLSRKNSDKLKIIFKKYAKDCNNARTKVDSAILEKFFVYFNHAYHSAHKYLNDEEALRLFLETDLFNILYYNSVVRHLLSPFIPLYSFSEYEEVIKYFIFYLKDNKSEILQTGNINNHYEKSIWLSYKLSKLFPTDSLINKIWSNRDLKEENIPIIHVRPPIISYLFSEQELETIKILRKKLFNLKIKILISTYRELRAKDGKAYLRKCKDILTEFISNKQLLEEVTSIESKYYVLKDDASNCKIVNSFPNQMECEQYSYVGGLFEIIDFIIRNYCEITYGLLNSVKSEINQFLSNSQDKKIFNYYHLVSVGSMEKTNTILNKYRTCVYTCIREMRKIFEEIGLNSIQLSNQGQLEFLVLGEELSISNNVFIHERYLNETESVLYKYFTNKHIPEKDKNTFFKAKFDLSKINFYDDIKITFLDPWNVIVNIKEKTYNENYKTLGFETINSNKPNKIWGQLLTIADANGVFCIDKINKKEYEKLKQQKTALKKTLMKVFPFSSSDPFNIIKEDQTQIIYKLKIELKIKKQDNIIDIDDGSIAKNLLIKEIPEIEKNMQLFFENPEEKNLFIKGNIDSLSRLAMDKIQEPKQRDIFISLLKKLKIVYKNIDKKELDNLSDYHGTYEETKTKKDDY